MKKEGYFVIASQCAAFVFLCFDLLYDFNEGISLVHITVESLIALAMVAVIGICFKAYYEKEKSRSVHLGKEIDSLRSQAENWKAEAGQYLKGLVVKIDDQFDQWGLSKAEKEVALLLIKGYSIKEIAALRDTSEKTIKQQNFSIYKKSKLPGRSELAAFFLEDLLLPNSSTDKAG